MTLEQAALATGMTDEDILREMYCRGYMKEELVAAAERGLRMAQPHFTGIPFPMMRPDTVPEAVHHLTEGAVPAAPLIDEARVRAEYPSLRRVWGSPRLWSGRLDEAAEIMRVNLERDRKWFQRTDRSYLWRRKRFNYFRVETRPDDYCAMVSSFYGKPPVTWYGYRLWRTEDKIFLCGHSRIIL
ncbi:hypothetical protein [Streptomyces mayteni]